MRLSVLLVTALALLAPAQQPAPSPTAPPVDTAHLLAMASRWTARFDQSLSGLLFRERYLQSRSYGSGVNMQPTARMTGAPAPRVQGNLGERLLEANVFLLRAPSARSFVVYRDVYKIGNAAVADHTERLQKLLVDGTADAIKQAKALTDASARLNIGDVQRNINIPTMALEYLTPAYVGGLRVRQAGTDTVDGLPVVVVEFQEIARPTLVLGSNNSDVPASGKFWIHAGSGAVVRAVAELETDGRSGRLEVHLMLHPELHVWVPKEMTEVWQRGNQRLTGLAHYDRFQRLTVSTEEIVK